MRYSLLRRTVVLVLLAQTAHTAAKAQKESRDEAAYREMSADLRKTVWNWKLPEFGNRVIPPEYAKYSSVVLARHVDLEAGVAKTREGMRSHKDFAITEITRELVKLNDAAAVKEYSEMSYTALKKTHGYSTSNSYATYLGVRVIKENGTTKDISIDDAVLTKDEKEEKKAKLAIPDLQPGDIIDYYIASELKEQQTGVSSSWPYYFTFIDDQPVLSYSVHCEAAPKYAVEYKRYNGAPDFKVNMDEDGYNILDVSAKNLDVYPSGTIWTSPFRQFPLIQMNIVTGYQGIHSGRFNTRSAGEVYRDQTSEVILFDEFMAIAQQKGTVGLIPQLAKKSDAVNDYYKELKRNADDMPKDSLAAALFYMFRYDLMFNVGPEINVPSFVNIRERSISPSAFAYVLMEYFRMHKLDAELLLTSSKFRPKIGEVMSKGDILYMVNVPEAKSPFFGVTDLYSCPFYIPASLENGKKAVSLDTKRLTVTNFKGADWHPVDIPATTAANNVHKELLAIDPDLGSNVLKVDRTTSLTGHYKDGTQKDLLLLEDFYNYERKFFNEDRTLVEKYAEKKRSRKLSEELEAAFAEARRKQKDAFLSDAKEFFELDIKDLAGQKVLNPGVRHTSPAFQYEATMNIQGLVKHAGNNYIVEVGKLAGSPVKVEEKQRDRKLDIYGPFARTLQVEVKMKVPDGYTAEGVESLNRNVSNESGAFKVTAKMDGNMLAITTERTYNKAMEPAASWPNLLAILDAASDFSNAKVLLKKKS